MGEEIKAKFVLEKRDPIKAQFDLVEKEPAKAVFTINPPSLNYNLLFNKPQINSVELVGNKSLSDLGIITAITTEINTHNTSNSAHPYIQGLITAESEARASADSTLQGNINTEIANRIAAINTEKQERQAADNTERNARIAADETLQVNIDNEEEARIEADTELQSNINDEEEARINADTELQVNIDNEASARATADATETAARIAAINTEKQERQAADASLQNSISVEATTRADADTTLQYNINTEATARANADDAIRDSIGNGNLYIQKNGITVATFTANQKGNTTANIVADTPAWGNITGTLSNQTDLQNALDNKVTKNSTITGATKCKITYDGKGLVTGGTDLSASDIPSLTLSKISDVTATAGEINLLRGVTNNVQTQINSKLNISSVINNVTTTTTNQALSANMGKELQDQITNLKQRGRYLSIWNCTTGLAETVPTVNPYSYKAGDYFIVGVVGLTNYKPFGSTYDKDVPSTTVETGDVVVNDTYYYDGTTWSLLHTSQPTVAFSTLAGSPYDNANLTTALNAKQDTLSAGTGISLSNNTVSINQVATEGYNINITGTLTTLNGVLSGFSSSDYAIVPVQFSPSDDSWEIVYKFTTASSKPSRYRYLLGSLQGSNSIVIGQYSTGVLTYWLSSQGGSNWDICSDQRGSIVLSDSTTYTVSVAYDGHSIYTMSISTDDGVSWDMDTSVTSSSDIYGGTIYLGSPYDRSNDTCWQGSIDLNNCRMKIGRQREIWIGFSTVENIAKATENLYGLVKPDNSTITVSNGVISASPAIDNTTITINASDQLQAVSLVGLTSTITELNYSDGVTSNIQTQLNNKSKVIWRTY